MYNRLKRSCVGCEAILRCKRVESYKGNIDFVIGHSPLCSRTEINQH